MASESNHGQKRPCVENLDRFSSLPDEVINKILMLLPIRKTVGTSRLSRSWRYRWLSIPKLVFDEHSIFQSQKFDKWVSFIDNVLLLNDGNITEFEVEIFSEAASPNMDRWLLMLSRKKLSCLSLSIDFQWPTTYMCPSTLFNFHHLRKLSLDCCDLQIPLQTQFDGFRNLTYLRLEHGTVNKETIEFLVNSSPLLEELTIIPWQSFLPHLSISAPNLRRCVILGKFGDITFIKTPKLLFVHIKKYNDWYTERCKLDGILGGLVQLQEAKITHALIELLSINSFLERLQITYYELKLVCMKIDFEDPKQILAALWIFRSSPALKKIVIKIHRLLGDGVYNQDIGLDELYKILDKKEAVLHSLDKIELEEFGGSKNELRFVQFVLLNAVVLQSMIIKWKEEYVAQYTRVRALVKLVEFPRTSSGLKVVNLTAGFENNYF